MNGFPAHFPVRLVVLVALAGLVAACEPSWNARAPVTKGPSGSAQSQRPLSVTVVAGDTVYSIARRYNLSVRDLLDANRLEPPYQLNPGQVLRLPGGGTDYVVQKGDTLLGLARRFKVDFNSLAATNNKTPPYVVRVGEHLTLPGGDRGGDPSPSVSTASTSPQAPAQQVQTQSSQVVPTSSPPPSPSSSPGRLVIASPHAEGGSPAVLPPPPRDTLANVPSSSSAGGASAPSSSSSSAQVPLQPPLSAPTPASTPTPAQTAAVAPVEATPPARSSGAFLWPVKGEVVAEFGPLPGKGQHNDGINIAVPRGTQVKAAENGVVVYVGNELKGFGNLLLIKHADGWMTAYAHTEQMKVRRGDRVRRGQIIATVGSSGNAAQPQLHFEIRRGTEAVNPLEHLQDRVSAIQGLWMNSFS
ncbi:peptidoglycan DD-metalloendopeptidase family protein [Magnetospirillum molischianum]|uniref:Membrane protein related to metalloendopeptidase n=1 Tax=Magnetospirillum molischianum DSM 120 TaxID=1150626 RepID=H8FRT2_MAGML|nr:peptidoglycan DD-metalloendopeptidase family protein [Magnetospirillum molischianum]CCG41070.1 Membrane protein related to metalloendopeptidase [Magnetospirillum molischianum DSM 120]